MKPHLSALCQMILVIFLAFFFVVLIQPAPSTAADPPTVYLEAYRAKALESCTDVAYVPPWCRQDFKVKIWLAGDPPVTSGYQTDRDIAAWAPFTVIHTLDSPTLPRFINATVELWDDDDADDDDQFDIYQDSGRALNLVFDTCTFRVNGGGLSVHSLGISEYPAGHESDPAQITLAFHMGDYRPLSPNDIAIADATPVQVVNKPDYIIADKPTSFRLQLTSSFPDTRKAKVTVKLSDGLTTVEEFREVWVPPDAGGVIVFFFDGVDGHQPPYYPRKPEGKEAVFTYDVNVIVEDEVDIPDPTWANCWSSNNSIAGATLPIVRTRAPLTVFARWNWLYFPGHHISEAELADYTAANAEFFKAIFPISEPDAHYTSTIFLTAYTALEPAGTISYMSRSAIISGIDRLVMTVPSDWFEKMDDASLLWVGNEYNSGMSLAEVADHAVLAESMNPEVAIHEIGHTYRLSQRACSPSDAGLWLLEYFGGMGCRDEYTHTAAEGRPYLAYGFDVLGNIYPNGWGTPSISRNLTGITNFMDTTPGTLYPIHHERWIDKFSYDYVANQMRLRSDPDILVLSGYIKIPGWPGPALGTPSGELLPIYKVSGYPTYDLPLYEQPAGEGLFTIRVSTGQGHREYRFTPTFGAEGDDFDEYGTGFGFFSFTVPWEPDITQIELLGPSEITPNAKLEAVLLASITPSKEAPSVTRLLAGRNAAPDMGGQGIPPHIGLGDQAYIKWSVSDNDTSSDQLRAALMLLPPTSQNPNEYTGPTPMAVDIEGNFLVIDYDQLKDRPGKYGGRVVVTDGFNTFSFDTSELFYIDPYHGTYIPFISK